MGESQAKSGRVTGRARLVARRTRVLIKAYDLIAAPPLPADSFTHLRRAPTSRSTWTTSAHLDLAPWWRRPLQEAAAALVPFRRTTGTSPGGHGLTSGDNSAFDFDERCRQWRGPRSPAMFATTQPTNGF